MATFYIGLNKSNPKETVVWDSAAVLNGHLIIVGGSGSGKTYRICDITRQLAPSGMRMHVFDAHGDIETDPEFTSTVEFSELSPYGINPLVVDPSPLYGGVRKRINTFIRTINKYSSRRLDNSEEATLRYLLLEFYSHWGYNPNSSLTWVRQDRPPTLDDFHDFVLRKLKGFLFGYMSGVADIFDRLHESLSTLRRLQRHTGRDRRAESREEKIEKERYENLVQDTREEVVAAVRSYIGAVQADEMDQMIRFGSREVLKSLYDRIENLRNMGVFKGASAPFDESKPIWRYDMSTLYVAEQGFLVELCLENIFFEAVTKGYKDHVDTLAFVDEAQRFLSAEDQDHIVSIVSREARKFGLGLGLATQNCAAFPVDIIINSATKMVLGVDEAYVDILSKTLGIEQIRYIQPRKTALVQIKTKKASVASRFTDTIFEAHKRDQ